METAVNGNILRQKLTTQKMWPIFRPSSPLPVSQIEFFHVFLTPFCPLYFTQVVHTACAMVKVKTRVAIRPAESITVTEGENVPTSVGVPVTLPPAESVKPMGRSC